MLVGVTFPQTEIGADPGGVRAYAEAVASLGYTHVLAYDHVLGADRAVHQGLTGPYGLDDTFHEPMVLFGWMAAFSSLELVTGILIAPQRQTALVAKQAAQVDIVSGGGRFRLGLGIGWNPVEYEALGMPFDRRGAILDEQIPLLRRLWTEERVTFAGQFHTVTAAGIAPLPPTRPIPIWLGGTADAALRRAGRLADGWFPLVAPGGRLDHSIEVVHRAARDAGRDPSRLGMEGRVPFETPDRFAELAERWRSVGATHLCVDTMHAGRRGPDAHIAAIGAAAEALGLHAPR